MADVSFRELTGGAGCSIISANPGPDLASNGYRENEYAASGQVDGSVPFCTRVLVRRPADDATFNGTLVVEWLNVSSGADAAPDYTYLADELVRGGYAWAGVSAQYTGIEGGPGSVAGLDAPAPRRLADKDPERYAGLHHPGDAYCHLIFGALGNALRSKASDHPMAGLTVTQVLAVGESQSAMALTTYANHHAAQHGVFDGILIHSRSAAGMPLGEPGRAVDIDTVFGLEPVTIGEDLPIPVLMVQTETDVLTNFGFHRARQPDTETVRTWEIAGTSHADHFQIGEYEDMLGCPTPVNRGQQRFVLRAGLRHLATWAAGGTPPPIAAPLAVTTDDDIARFVLDVVGNATDGVRTPCVDAPTQVLSGVVTGDDVPRICVLFGSTTPIPAEQLRERYRDVDDYLAQYTEATDRMIADGFATAEDRDELLADARPDLI